MLTCTANLFLAPVFNYLENALQKFDDRPFLLGGQFYLVDIASLPFVDRVQIYFSEVMNHDITTGRPKFAAWIEGCSSKQ
ncbi:glutathione S-transferase L3-like isoform X1 [Euphorbia lathyris]|uniref:glutathione S-transferase L3-like isoform X1 n=1 Tax=Euphorbia lathyris TaxID=212925 RepID=UPI0033138F47